MKKTIFGVRHYRCAYAALIYRSIGRKVLDLLRLPEIDFDREAVTPLPGE